MKINIITATDNNYSQHLGVALASLLENSPKRKLIRIYVLFSNLSEENKKKLRSIVEKFKSQILFLKISPNKLKNCPVSHHINITTYFRILIPLIFPKMKKALYLDSDIVVLKDIANLYKTNIKNYYLAACPDPAFENYNILKIPKKYGYFNSGVMLLNLEKLRKENISLKLINFIEKNPEKIRFWDQDALNKILYKNWLKIKPIWNQQRVFFKKKLKQNFFTKEELKEAITHPAIIHFTSPSKPWHYLDNHSFKRFYYFYLQKTPWKNYSPRDRNFKNFLKKYIKLFLKIIGIYY